MYEKGCNGVNQSSLRIFNVLLVFYLKLMNLNAFDFRSVHSAGVQTIYFSLPSPHIPIAALAANRVIIIVINITFLPLKPLNLLTSNTFYFLPIDFSLPIDQTLPIVFVILSMQSFVFTFDFTYLLVIP